VGYSTDNIKRTNKGEKNKGQEWQHEGIERHEVQLLQRNKGNQVEEST
jgi:hypothetical protein